MRRSKFFAVVFAATCLASVLRPAQAAITWTGQVVPSDPTTWDSTTWSYIGQSANGSLSVDSGSSLYSNGAYIAYNAGVTGAVTLTGAASTWATTGWCIVGQYGNGTLNITGGASVTAGFTCEIGCQAGSTGAVTVDGAGSALVCDGLGLDRGTLSIVNGGTVAPGGMQVGGTLTIGSGGRITLDGNTGVTGGTIQFNPGAQAMTTESLYFSPASPTQLTGTGTINTRGMVADSNLVFDSTHGLYQTFVLGGQPTRNVTVNLDMTDPATVGDLGAGWDGSASPINGGGTLTIRDGVQVRSARGLLYGSSAATVAGTGTGWIIQGSLEVGPSGSLPSTLNITGGATVTASGVSVGDANEQSTISIDSQSALEILVGHDPIAGYGGIVNNGKVRAIAGPTLADGAVYRPLKAAWWNGTGAYQALGGAWDSNSGQFTVGNTTSGISGQQVSLNRTTTQRALIGDPQSGRTVGAAVTSGAGTMTLTATPIQGATLQGLKSQVTTDQLDQLDVIAWMFATTNYSIDAIHPIYFSFDVGGGYEHDQRRFQLWHYDGAAWSQLDANDLTYDGQYASFTATAPGGYAVAVPEPCALGLLLVAAAGVLGYGWRKRQA